ncbi:MAG: GAF domain-containing protein [Oscillochloris sp.]|nr:GAF domain-containing protein [Oscillochloris sp.]
MDSDISQTTSISAILELSRLVCATLDRDEVFERVLTSAQALSGAEVLSIMLLDEARKELSVAAIIGLDLEPLADLRLPLGEGIAGWVVANNEPAHVADPVSDPRFMITVGLNYGTLYSVPLWGRNGVLGCLNVSRLNDNTPFSLTVLQMVDIFASHAAIAIENAAAARALQLSAIRERMHMLTQQPYDERLIDQILAELGQALDADGCSLIFEHSGVPIIRQRWPADLEATTIPISLCSGLRLPDSSKAQLCIHRVQNSRYQSGGDRELTEFVADRLEVLLHEEHRRSQALQQRALDDALGQIASASHALVGRENVLESILSRLADFVTYDSAGVFAYHDTDYARLVGGRGYRNAGADIVLYMGPGSLPWQIAQEHRAHYIPDVQQLPQWQDVPDADLVRAWIGVPLLVDNAMIGLLTIDRWTPHSFEPRDIVIAERFGAHLALTIRNARMVQEAQNRANQLQALHQLGVEIGVIYDEQQLFETLVRLIQRTFGYYQVCVATIENHEVVLQSVFGEVADKTEFGTLQRYTVERGITGWAARYAETVLVNDVRHDSRYALVDRLSKARAELVVPIKSEGEVLGIIDIESSLIGAFGESDIQVIEALAGQIGIALRNIRRYRELEHTQSHLLHGERLRALGEMASGVAHDFNNLLTSILGHTQILRDSYAEPALREALQIIERAALDGAATVRRLQGFAQMGNPLPDEQIDLNAIIEESLAITRPRWRDSLQSQGAQLEIRREIGNLPLLAGDPAALRDMSTNLILNAIDAMPQGGILTIRTAMLPGDQAVVLWEVCDNGRGIPADILPKIFTPFFSTKGSRGTGMGLAMAHSTVERHKGRIEVQSDPGRGSCFSIMLPVRELRQPELANPPVPAIRQARALHILVAEDDPAVRRLMDQMLLRFGHQVDLAPDGESALHLLMKNSYDLLCSDLGLPGMSGWELIRQAKDIQPQLRTLLITGWGNQIVPEEARNRGADLMISKPFDVTHLRQAIEQLSQQIGQQAPAGRR